MTPRVEVVRQNESFGFSWNGALDRSRMQRQRRAQNGVSGRPDRGTSSIHSDRSVDDRSCLENEVTPIYHWVRVLADAVSDDGCFLGVDDGTCRRIVIHCISNQRLVRIQSFYPSSKGKSLQRNNEDYDQSSSIYLVAVGIRIGLLGGSFASRRHPSGHCGRNGSEPFKRISCQCNPFGRNAACHYAYGWSFGRYYL